MKLPSDYLPAPIATEAHGPVVPLTAALQGIATAQADAERYKDLLLKAYRNSRPQPYLTPES